MKWKTIRSATEIVVILSLPCFPVFSLDILTRSRARSDAAEKLRAR